MHFNLTKLSIKIVLGLTAFFYISPSYAHLGHVGELAGHSHWVAIGAALAAGVVGGLIIKSGKSHKNKEKTQGDEADDAPSEPDVEVS